MKFPRPCLDCGRLTNPGQSRCDEHQAKQDQLKQLRDAPRKAQRKHYSGNYASRAKKIRENALFCHLCGQGTKATDPWTADHLIPGDPSSPLAAAHRSCNSRRGNKPLP